MVLPPSVKVTNVTPKVGVGDSGPNLIVVTKEGPPGQAGPPGSGYTWLQTTPASVWTVDHNLGHRREPDVYLSTAPDVPVYPDFECSPNTTTIIFPDPVTGRAEF